MLGDAVSKKRYNDPFTKSFSSNKLIIISTIIGYLIHALGANFTTNKR